MLQDSLDSPKRDVSTPHPEMETLALQGKHLALAGSGKQWQDSVLSEQAVF